MVGPLPVFYPFIVSNPGEAAQAKRRIAAVTIGHLPPPLVAAELSNDARDLERLVDEYAQADGLDRRRRERLAGLIVETRGAAASRVRPASMAKPMPTRCWPASTPGCATSRTSPSRTVSTSTAACRRRSAPIRPPIVLAGERRQPSAPRCSLRSTAGGCARPGRRARARTPDVLPTGRNLYTADPRMLPTPTAMDLGARAADEVIRDYLQAHGEMPRALVHRSLGQRDAAHRRRGDRPRPRADGMPAGLGSRHRPRYRHRGEPPAAIGRPRVDVTWRISGLFRDLFPAQIALIDAAVRAVAARGRNRRRKSARRPVPRGR